MVSSLGWYFPEQLTLRITLADSDLGPIRCNCSPVPRSNWPQVAVRPLGGFGGNYLASVADIGIGQASEGRG
jgi:hypothetical protein